MSKILQDIKEENVAKNDCNEETQQKCDNKNIQAVKKEQGKFNCELCSKTFIRKCNLEHHLTKHIASHQSVKENESKGKDDLDNKKPFLCEHCGQCYKLSGSLNRHMQIHMPENYECKVCGKLLTHPYRVARHMKMHSGKKQQCDVCGKLFAHKSALKKHTLSHGDKVLECPVCQKKFSHKTYLDVHMVIHTGDKRYSCEVCGKRFAQKSQLNVHISTHIGIKKFPCTVCGKRFSQRTSLNHHMSVHTNEKVKCTLCEKEYKNKSSLNIHMSVHSGKVYPCQTCGKEFKHKSSLYSHMCSCQSVKDGDVGDESETEFDIDVQSLLCGECGDSYQSLKDLSMHMKIHNVDPQQFMKNVDKSLHVNRILHYRVKKRPKGLACEKCGTLFSHKSALNTHMKASHSSTKEFKCLHCGKEFARKSYLDSHTVIHTGERNYKCHICCKHFTQKGSLNSHMNLHTERYKCDDCGKLFGRGSDFQKHKNEVHLLKVKVSELPDEPEVIISQEILEEEADCKMVEIDEIMDIL